MDKNLAQGGDNPSDGAVTQPPPPANEVYGIFVGMIDQAAVARLSNAAAISTSNRVTHIHLAFQTAGGTVPDGVAIYNLFRALPIPLSLYNIGSVSSAGVTAYLGANRRCVSKHGSFMIHRTVSPPLGVTSERLEAMAHSVVLDDTRTEEIYKEAKVNLTLNQRATHSVADLWLSADEAIAAKIAMEVAEFAPPKGTQIFFLGAT